MEALYKSFQSIPLDAVSFQGLVMIVIIVGVLIFKFAIKKPKKKDK